MSQLFVYEILDSGSLAWERFPQQVPFTKALRGEAAEEIYQNRSYYCTEHMEPQMDDEGSFVAISNVTWTCKPPKGETLTVDGTNWPHAERLSGLAKELERLTGRDDLIIIIS